MYYVGDGSFRVRRDPVPALGPGQVLTAVEAGICETDLHITHAPSTHRHNTEISAKGSGAGG
jgi:D-arabinose 1-dehydrogenase-like Zn-dependent alcohol dehydrogenase